MTSRGPMSACSTYQPMIGSRPGELDAAEAAALEAHLGGCRACQAWAAELASTEWLVSEALMAQAAKRDFAPFVDGVMARVERTRPQPLLSRLAAAMRLHPRLVIGGALAPLVAALAVSLWLRGGTAELASLTQLEVSAEGGATTIIQSADGPLVLIDDDDEET